MISLRWNFSEVADRVGEVLRSAEAELRLEQAVKGLDGRDERELQALLAAGLRENYEVAREVHYPSTAANKLSHRMRCDLVLTGKGRPLKLDSVEAGLFDPMNQVGPEEGLWLEVKIAYQFREGNVPHSGYGSQWRNAVVEDLKKMEGEAMIHEAGLLLIVFNESAKILEKDLELFEDILVKKEVLAGFRQVRSVGILDRIGHGVCTAALWPTIQRAREFRISNFPAARTLAWTTMSRLTGAMARSERSAGVVVFRAGVEGREYLLLDSGRFWDFPKGHLEKGETDLAAAMRELQEEAAIDDARLVPGFSQVIRYFFREGKTLVDKTVVYFLAESAKGKARVSDEHVGFEFLPYEKARERLKYANAREILRLADEFLKAGPA